MFYDCCTLAFEGRGANWRLPFLPAEKVQISRALPSQLCLLCALSEAFCGSRELLSSPFPWLVETAHAVFCLSGCPEGRASSWKQSSVCCGEYSPGEFPLPATEMSVDWLGLASDRVFSGFRLNCQFLSARKLLNDSAHPCLLTGDSNTLVGNRISGEASNGLPFEPVPTRGQQDPQSTSGLWHPGTEHSIIPFQGHSCLPISFRLISCMVLTPVAAMHCSPATLLLPSQTSKPSE